MATKHLILRAHLNEWIALRGDRKKRGELGRQLAKTARMHPKSIPRSMRTLQLTPKHQTPKKRGRERFYTKDVDAAVCTIWETMGFPCAETMHPILRDYVESFERSKEWIHSDEATLKLTLMSVSTLKRRIAALRVKEHKTRGYGTTRPSTMQTLIPIRKSHTWVDLPPGYGQMDTVAHCGDFMGGDFVYSLGIVDFRTYWVEYDTQWQKSKAATRDTIQRLVPRFPFRMHELHPDSGTEFLNAFVYEWARENNIAMTRSEEYKKNDNMCVEERNNTMARRHLGYARLDDRDMLPLAQEVMRTASLIHNHFRPVKRMISKERSGARWKRTYEKVGVTPYGRVLVNPYIPDQDKEKLRAVHAKLDPLSLERKLATLKQEIIRKLSRSN